MIKPYCSRAPGLLPKSRDESSNTLGAGLIFLLLFFVQGVFFIRANSPTYDEAMHLAAGYSYLATGDFRLEPKIHHSSRVFLALPLFLAYGLPFNPDPQQWRDGTEFFVGQDFLYRSTLPADQMLAVSRVPNLFLGGILIALTGWWAYRLWGAVQPCWPWRLHPWNPISSLIPL